MHHGCRPLTHSSRVENFRVESRKVGAVRPQEDSTARQQQVGTARRRDGARLLERKTTLATIAAEAGVSLPTVSKVVNGRPDVVPAPRARVDPLVHHHQDSSNGTLYPRRSAFRCLVSAGLVSP